MADNCFKDNISRIEWSTMNNSPRPIHSPSRDDKHSFDYYYHRQADFEEEGDEEISGED